MTAPATLHDFVKPDVPAEPILVARGMTKQFGGFLAVKDVNLTVRRGSIHALIGPNGAGKTTCFNLLTKFLIPTRGTIHFRGEDITKTDPAEIARKGLVRSFQISSVFPQLSVLENARIALQRPEGLATQFWLPRSRLRALNARAAELVDAVGLGPWARHTAAELSYGRKRALELATTLALEPELLLLDEPMAGMGHEDINLVTGLIRQVAVGRTVLMVEHNLDVVAGLCDRVTVLRRGEILAEGTYAEGSADAEVRAAYLGSEDDED
jgi:branched-chain amino acid transport system ATP-binding protein